ncbi:unnamed protein product, partial [Mesorhabditis belari]|uniref:G-protein-signaling modulator 2 n=1 Tax=Mesorhabditis belari TaxID=2138241 RepID=A0AAF3J6C3_9BILA
MKDRNERCLEVAKEGERLIRDGHFDRGIESMEAAIAIGTSDLLTLSAIYSQLGNAFFSVGSYSKAIEFHRNDLLLARVLNDRTGEAKACGNLGNAMKAVGQYEMALSYFETQLKLAKQLNDRFLESRALFHLGTAHQARGKELSRMCPSTNDVDGPTWQQAKDDLNKSNDYFRVNLDLARTLNDSMFVGRILGHLGNNFYILRDFRGAVDYHMQRLDIAHQFGDRQASRRAYTNLANAHMMLNEARKAIEYYRLAYSVAHETEDKYAEAQNCFSLANAAIAIKDYPLATEFHLRHLKLARECGDVAGEMRALSSLSLDFFYQSDLRKAAYFLEMGRKLAKQMGDRTALEMHSKKLTNLIDDNSQTLLIDGEIQFDWTADPDGEPSTRLCRSVNELREPQMDERTDCGLSRQPISSSDTQLNSKLTTEEELAKQDAFFDLLLNVQGKRLNDQRCDAGILTDLTNRGPRQTDSMTITGYETPEQFIEYLLAAQGRRMEEQRAHLFPGLADRDDVLQKIVDTPGFDEDLYDLVIKSQSKRFNDQRTDIDDVPGLKFLGNLPHHSATTVPEEDIMEIVLKMAAGRLDDQRASLNPSA